MIISIPTAYELQGVNIENIIPEYSPFKKMTYLAQSQLSQGTGVYQNTGETYTPSVANIWNTIPDIDTVQLGDIYYSDNGSMMAKVTRKFEAGTPLVPISYTNDTSLNYNDWSNRYLMFKERPYDVQENINYNIIRDKGVGGSLFGGSTRTNCLEFNSTGTKMFTVVNYTNDSEGYIQEHNLVDFDVQTAYPYKRHSTGDVDFRPQDIIFTPDGLRAFYVVHDVYTVPNRYMTLQYDLTQAYDLSTKHTEVQKESYVNDEYGILFNADGTVMYEDGISYYKFNLSVPYDISTAVHETDILHEFVPGTSSFIDSGTGAGSGVIGSYGIASEGKRAQYDITNYDLNTRTQEIISPASSNYNGKMVVQGSGSETVLLENVHNQDGTNSITRSVMSNPLFIDTAFYALFPANRIEDRSGTLHFYSIVVDSAGGLYFSDTLNFTTQYAGASISFVNSLLYPTETISGQDVEEKADTSLAASTSWVPKTGIVRREGIYIRTDEDVAPQEAANPGIDLEPAWLCSDLKHYNYIQASEIYKVFDDKNYTYTSAQTSLTYTIQGTESFDTVAFGKIIADTVKVEFYNPQRELLYTVQVDIDNSRDSLDNLSAAATTEIIYSDTLMVPQSTVDITLTGASIQLGTILFGCSVDTGFTNLSMTNKYKDFSVFEYDAWGNADYVERAKVSSYQGTVDIFIENYDMTDRLMNSLGKKLVIINGSSVKNAQSDSLNIFAATKKIGRFMSFDQKTNIKFGELSKMATYSFQMEEIV